MSNNLTRKISKGEIFFGFGVALMVFIPHLLTLIFSDIYLFKLISEGAGWYIYLTFLLVVVVVVEVKYKNIIKSKREKQG